MYIVEKAGDIYGKVTLTGSKNAALPILFSSLLCKDAVVLKNFPFGIKVGAIIF